MWKTWLFLFVSCINVRKVTVSSSLHTHLTFLYFQWKFCGCLKVKHKKHTISITMCLLPACVFCFAQILVLHHIPSRLVLETLLWLTHFSLTCWAAKGPMTTLICLWVCDDMGQKPSHGFAHGVLMFREGAEVCRLIWMKYTSVFLLVYTCSSSCLSRCSWDSSCLLWSSSICIRASSRPLCCRSSFASAMSSASRALCGDTGSISGGDGSGDRPFLSWAFFRRSYSDCSFLQRQTDETEELIYCC